MRPVTTNNFIEAEFNIRKLVDLETHELKFAFYADDNLLFTTDKDGIIEISNLLDYLLREVD